VFTSNLSGKRDCDTFAACKKLLDDGKTIHWRGASSNFDKFGDFEPNEGVYDVWSYDATGRVQIEDASSQIAVG
jgi:branched-chain amino acid transport system substrate-binding protein